MNKIQLINGKGISESLANMCNDTCSVEIEFELENMPFNTNEDIQAISKQLNVWANDDKISYKEWVLVSSYENAILFKAHDTWNNVKYLKLMKESDK